MPARITKTNPINNQIRTMQFDLLDQDDFERRYLMYRRGEITLDEAYPMLSRDARNFISCGLTLEEQDDYFGNNITWPS